MLKKILSVILAASMLLSVFAFSLTSASAEEDSPQITNVTGYAESEDPSRLMGAAIDGNTETFWHTKFNSDDVVFATDKNNSYYLDLGAEYVVDKFEYVPKQKEDKNGKITDFELYGTLDTDRETAQWTLIDTVTGWTYGTAGEGMESHTLEIADPQPWRMLRIQVNGATKNATETHDFICAAEFKVYGTEAKDEPIYMDCSDMNIAYNAETGYDAEPWSYFAVNADGDKVELTTDTADVDLGDTTSKSDKSGSTYRVGKYGFNTNPDSTGYTEIGYRFTAPYEGTVSVDFTRDIFGSNNGNAAEMYIKIGDTAVATYTKTTSDRAATAEDKAINSKWNYIYEKGDFTVSDKQVAANDTVSITGKMGGSYNKNMWLTPVITYSQLTSKSMLQYYKDVYVPSLDIMDAKKTEINTYIEGLGDISSLAYAKSKEAVDYIDSIIAKPDSDYVWEYVVYEDDKESRITKYNGTDVNVVVPAQLGGYDVVAIESYTFQDAYESGVEIESVVIPDTVKFIRDSSFRGLASLKSVTFGNSVQSINRYAFRDCTNLEMVDLPESCYIISDGCFIGCQNLKTIIIRNERPTIENSGASSWLAAIGFMDILQKTKIEGITIVGVPGSNSEKYTQIYPHIKFMSIDDYENGGILGDVNGDGVVDINDATLIQKYIVGISVDNFNADLADVNEDGTINIYDVTSIQLILNKAK